MRRGGIGRDTGAIERTVGDLVALGACLCLLGCGASPERGEGAVATSSEALTLPALNQLVIAARRSASFDDRSVISGGHIGVAASTTSSPNSLVAGSDTHLGVGEVLAAQSITLRDRAVVGELHTNALVAPLSAVTGPVSPFIAPPAAPVPGAVTAGTAPVNVNSGATLTLAPGAFGAVTVSGTLRLSGGLYKFQSLRLNSDARLFADAAATVRAVGAVTALDRAHLQPSGTLPAGALRLVVARGTDAVTLGNDVVLHALVIASGDFRAGDRLVASGAITGNNVAIGHDASLTFDTGFACASDANCDDGNPCTDDACVDAQCGHTKKPDSDTCFNGSAHGSQQLQGHLTPELLSAPLVGPLPPDTLVHIAVGLPVRTPDILAARIAAVSDPVSSSYRQYLTPAQFAAQFGALETDYDALVAWAGANGLSVAQSYPNRLLLALTGTAANVENALFARLQIRTRPDGTQFYMLDREPSLNLTTTVLHISGTDNFFVPAPRGASGPLGGFQGADFRNAYASCTSMDGTGQSVGIFSIGDFTMDQIHAYESEAGIPDVPINAIPVAGGVTVIGNDIETPMDIEMALAMAPGLSHVDVFEGADPASIIHAMATTEPRSNQLTTSFGFSDDANTQAALDELAMQGQSFFDASGDNGAYRASVDGDPTFSNLTLVGGTTLVMNGPGVSYQSEVGWSNSGGGIIPRVPIPAYQQGIDVTTNGGSTQFRNGPDVAMVALHIEVVISGPEPVHRDIGGGSSAAAPLWAGFMALVNQQDEARGLFPVGFANPVLYRIGADPVAYHSSFNDIATGNNGFPAVAGYDLVTGLGTPKCGLINRLASPDPLANHTCNPDYVVTETSLPFTGLANPTSITTGPDGNLWITQAGSSIVNFIHRLNPTTGAISSFLTPSTGTTPNGITAGPDGNLWFTELDGQRIGQITPAGAITEFPIPGSFSGPSGITTGPDNNLWFTELVGSIGRITPAGSVSQFVIPNGSVFSSSDSIASGSDGNLWFTVQDKIDRITPAGVISQMAVLPNPTQNDALLRKIAAGPDGNL
jgi:hypothetical protein